MIRMWDCDDVLWCCVLKVGNFDRKDGNFRLLDSIFRMVVVCCLSYTLLGLTESSGSAYDSISRMGAVCCLSYTCLGSLHDYH